MPNERIAAQQPREAASMPAGSGPSAPALRREEAGTRPRLGARAARAAFRRNEFAESERLCRMLLERHPGHPEALGLLGIIAVKTRRLDLAMELLPGAAVANPRNAAVHTHLGAALLLLDRSAEALPSLDRALELAPRDVVALNVRACALGNLGRLAESIECCDRALKVRPDYVAALVNRGNACAQLGRHQDALESFEKALAVEPGSVEAINNCANILKALGRRQEALARYAEALRLRPDYAEAAFNQGVTLAELGRHRDAIRSYRHALGIRPDHPDARYNLSLCHLLLGDFERAWQDQGLQLDRAPPHALRRRFDQPQWLGDRKALCGRTVLLHADEGLGDTLQFSRYAREVAALGARVVLEVQRPLVKVLTGLKGAHRVVRRGSRLPRFDLHCPLMRLPAVFRTDLATIPEHGPYIRSEGTRAERWHKRLGPRSGLRIGLAWSGNPAHANDANRSLALAALAPLLQYDADWVSLQQEVRGIDAAFLPGQSRLRHYGRWIRDFADTAALVDAMDLVIAVDTSVAHLAGAMGKPVWILLPVNPDWRWLLRRADSPWYPSARLFRQTAVGDWAGVLGKVRRALARGEAG